MLLLGKVEGMEVGLTLVLENQKGSLKLSLTDCGCYVKDISIKLDGGASWLYQGYAIFISVYSICVVVFCTFCWQFDICLHVMWQFYPLNYHFRLCIMQLPFPLNKLSFSILGFLIEALEKQILIIPYLSSLRSHIFGFLQFYNFYGMKLTILSCNIWVPFLLSGN